MNYRGPGTGDLGPGIASFVVALLLVAAGADAQDSSEVRRRWMFLPGLGWAPETGLQGAFTVLTISTSRRDTTQRPSSAQAYVVRTAKAQTRIGLDLDRWLPGNRRRVQASLNAVEYPYSFYGIGDNTADSAQEKYVPRWIEGFMQVDERVRPRLFLSYALRAGYQEVTPKSPGLIQSELVPGSRTTRTVVVSAGATYDSRDRVVSTHRGQLASLTYGLSAPALGATYSYGRLDAEWRGFREVAPGHVLGAHANVVGTDGEVPFDQMAIVGGGRIMRGYSAGRFRDRWVAAVQGEYRTPMLFDKIGAVVFAGVGAAAPRPGALFSGRPFPSVGIGGRIQADRMQGTALRADYAVGAYGFSALYLGFNQAF